ncbi:MAG: hypothetical protein BMS9Abin15_1082 [Gammaproteobacteria bacterium]|nr:MAG: hypothetical protein BMS9Abin15_1082 [Gammaproteobacteria bacterium]
MLAFALLLPASVPAETPPAQAEDKQTESPVVTVEMLEFLASFETDNGDWQDPFLFEEESMLPRRVRDRYGY